MHRSRSWLMRLMVIVALAMTMAYRPAMGQASAPSGASDAGRSEAARLNAPPALLASTKGRELLRYIVQCALPEGKTLSTEADGRPLSFPGLLGLAPKWAAEPLSETDQRWVSACVLSRMNLFGVHVPISLQGDHPAPGLRTRGQESKDFTTEEGAFFGNLFLADPVGYACRGKRPYPKRHPWVGKRVCTQPKKGASGVTRCDLVDAGRCADVCRSRDPVSGAYLGCKAPDGVVYEEVLTTYLRDH